MNDRTVYLALAAAFVAVACESSPRPKQATSTSEPKPAIRPALDADALVATAEQLRDREFDVPPKLEADDDFEPRPLPGCEARCQDERRWLTKILFAGDAPVVATPLATFDRERNVLVWDRSKADDVARAAVLAELVRALDRLDGAPADSWDAYLTSTALRRGAGVFVAALDRAQTRSDHIDSARLAMRPEALYDLEFTQNRFADDFSTREGFAFTAALIRSGGWSAVELAYHERPDRTVQIVRPDRYLAGDQPGAWTLPDELERRRADDGLQAQRSGRVGPAVFAEWLAQRVPAAAARIAYVGHESDHYQLYTGDDGAWAFDWVSLWRTPTIAEQIIEALDAGLRARDDDATFLVLRKGATVAVVADSRADVDLSAAGTALVGTLPVFRQPQPRGVRFVPTPIDRLNTREQVSSIAREPWTDDVVGVSVDLEALPESWKLLPTTEPNLPWFAKHESGAVLQYLVEPQPLFDPPFSEPAYAELMTKRFATTVASEEPPTVKRVGVPSAGALRIDARGTVKDRGAEGPMRLRAWHFASSPFVVTVSLQAPVDRFDAHAAEIEPLLASIELKSHETQSDGVIKFTVEE